MDLKVLLAKAKFKQVIDILLTELKGTDLESDIISISQRYEILHQNISDDVISNEEAGRERNKISRDLYVVVDRRESLKNELIEQEARSETNKTEGKKNTPEMTKKKRKLLTGLIDYFVKKVKNKKLKEVIETVFTIAIIVIVGFLLITIVKTINPNIEDIRGLITIGVSIVVLYFIVKALIDIPKWLSATLGLAFLIIAIIWSFDRENTLIKYLFSEPKEEIVKGDEKIEINPIALNKWNGKSERYVGTKDWDNTLSNLIRLQILPKICNGLNTTPYVIKNNIDQYGNIKNESVITNKKTLQLLYKIEFKVHTSPSIKGNQYIFNNLEFIITKYKN